MLTKMTRLFAAATLGGGILITAAGPALAAAPVITLQTSTPQAVRDARGTTCTPSPTTPGCDNSASPALVLDTYSSVDSFGNGVSSDTITVTASPYQNINLEQCKPNPATLNDCDAYTQVSETGLTPDTPGGTTSFHGTFTDAGLYVEPSGAAGDGGNINCTSSKACVEIAQKSFNDFVDAYGVSAPFTFQASSPPLPEAPYAILLPLGGLGLLGGAFLISRRRRTNSPAAA